MSQAVYKYEIKLKGSEKRELRQAKRKGQCHGRLITRILIILWAAKGRTIAKTAKWLECSEQTVLNWRKWFLARRSQGAVKALMDLPRSGRPVTYGAPERARVVAVVCETLHKHEWPLSRFSTKDLLQIVTQEADLPTLSHASLGRILAQDALKPWQYRYWLFPRDPDFVKKACIVLDLYAGFWQGERLEPDDYLLSADEKTIQVLMRLHEDLPPAPGRTRRIEFEYKRLGTVAYHAVWDVFRGKLFGRVAPNTCIDTFKQLVDLVMAQAPYRDAARVFWLADGGPAHHPNTFPARLQAMYPNAIAVSLPIHASWLNQIEIVFSIVQRKVLTPMDVPDQDTLSKRLMDFQDYYQQTAKPFAWKFTADDLKKRLDALKPFAVT
jgi:hypothetical protein